MDKETQITTTKLEEVEADIKVVEAAIEEAGNKIKDIETRLLAQSNDERLLEDLRYYRRKEEQLRMKEERLRMKEEQLRAQLHPSESPGPSKKQKLDTDVERLRLAFEDGKVEDGYLNLDQSVCMRGQSLPSKIFVRQAYKDIHDKIHNNDRKHFLVTGNPGVGKTCFSLYELHCLLQRLRSVGEGAVIYHSALLDVRYTFTTQTCSAETDDEEFLRLIRDDSTYYLFDAGTKSFTKPEITSRVKKAIVFSSPNVANYQDWAKSCEDGHVEFIMPVWEYDELKLLPKLSGLKPSLSERFKWFGGIPRYLQTQDTPAILKGAIETSDMDKLIRSVSSNEVADITHKLVHVVPNDDYKQTSVVFASKYVTELFYKKLESGVENLVINTLEGWKNTTLFSSVRGQLFELWAHETLCRGGNFPTRELTESGPKSVQKLCLKSMTPKQFSNCDELLELYGDNNNYLQPTQHNFESLDSLAYGKGFQMTVSKSHPIKRAGLTRVLKAIQHRSGTPFSLYFVVPGDVFDAFKTKQKYHTKEGETPKTGRTCIDDVRQYVVCLSLTQV